MQSNYKCWNLVYYKQLAIRSGKRGKEKELEEKGKGTDFRKGYKDRSYSLKARRSIGKGVSKSLVGGILQNRHKYLHSIKYNSEDSETSITKEEKGTRASKTSA